MMRYLSYLLVGVLLGVVMFKSQAASWFRIYEMFQFGAFWMYGIIGSAVVIGIVGVQLIKRYKIKAFGNRPMQLTPKKKSVPRYLVGGIIFGLGWALAGACPAPMFVLVGAGYPGLLVVILGALLGTFIYGVCRKYLSH